MSTQASDESTLTMQDADDLVFYVPGEDWDAIRDAVPLKGLTPLHWVCAVAGRIGPDRFKQILKNLDERRAARIVGALVQHMACADLFQGRPV